MKESTTAATPAPAAGAALVSLPAELAGVLTGVALTSVQAIHQGDPDRPLTVG